MQISLQTCTKVFRIGNVQRGGTVVTRPATMKVTCKPISEKFKLISSCPWTPAKLCAEQHIALCIKVCIYV